MQNHKKFIGRCDSD